MEDTKRSFGTQTDDKSRILEWDDEQDTKPVLEESPTSSISSIVQTPNQWPSMRKTSSCSPIELTQCVSMGISFVQHMVPGLAVDDALQSLRASTSTDAFQEQLAMVCLLAVMHLRDELPWAAGGIHRIFKAPILARMKRIMGDSVAATSPATLAILGGLSTFEDAINSPEASVHLRGIASILRVRGGVKYCGFGGGLRKHLEMVDIIWAVKNYQLPVYSDSVIPLLSPMSEIHKIMSVPRGKFDLTGHFSRPSLAWQWSERLNYFTEDDIYAGIAERKSEFEPIYLLQTDSDGFMRRIWVPESAVLFSHAATMWQVRIRDVSRRKSCKKEISVACRLAGRLIGAGFDNPSLAAELNAHLHSLDVMIWSFSMGLHTRILLVALASTSDPDERGWICSELAGLIARARLYDWLVLKLIILDFIYLQLNWPVQ